MDVNYYICSCLHVPCHLFAVPTSWGGGGLFGAFIPVKVDFGLYFGPEIGFSGPPLTPPDLYGCKLLHLLRFCVSHTIHLRLLPHWDCLYAVLGHFCSKNTYICGPSPEIRAGGLDVALDACRGVQF